RHEQSTGKGDGWHLEQNGRSHRHEHPIPSGQQLRGCDSREPRTRNGDQVLLQTSQRQSNKRDVIRTFVDKGPLGSNIVITVHKGTERQRKNTKPYLPSTPRWPAHGPRRYKEQEKRINASDAV